MSGRPVLRYFDCRSRGQALRFALADLDVDFEDERVPTSALADFKRAVERGEDGGPFGTLPVLRWGDVTVAQTLAVAGYLAVHLGLAEASATPERRAHLDMITSAAHLDLQVPYSFVLWLPEDCEPERLRAQANALWAQLSRGVTRLGRLLAADEGPFFGGETPAMADYFVYESMSRARDVFGNAFDSTLDEEGSLAGLVHALDTRPSLSRYRERGRVPFQVTASPSERRIRERLASEAW